MDKPVKYSILGAAEDRGWTRGGMISKGMQATGMNGIRGRVGTRERKRETLS
jgi:hypothetical protein